MTVGLAETGLGLGSYIFSRFLFLSKSKQRKTKVTSRLSEYDEWWKDFVVIPV